MVRTYTPRETTAYEIRADSYPDNGCPEATLFTDKPSRCLECPFEVCRKEIRERIGRPPVEITPQEIAEIRRLYQEGVPIYRLAVQWKRDSRTIRRIVNE